MARLQQQYVSKKYLIGSWITIIVIWSSQFPSSTAQTDPNPELVREIHFQLFTRQNPTVPQILELEDVTLLQQSNYDINRETKLFAHGLGSSPVASYGTRNAYLQVQDCNFIAVDWSAMAVGNYSYVGTYYVPLAGKLTGQFVNFLIAQGTQLDNIHLTGHSFGSHVVGYAGAAVTSGRVARITGLDPSHTDEFFPLEDIDSRLDTTDAQFVDIIHTEGRFTVPIGHIDFFPNGGLTQPGCETNPAVCCAHCRAVDYFSESIISNVGFRSLRCDSWDEYQSGNCDANESALMGEYVPKTMNGSFYLYTNAVSPFAIG